MSLPALVGVLFLCFCLLQVVPTDPAQVIAGPDARPETVAAIREELGLDRPIPVQFVEYIGRVARGDTSKHLDCTAGSLSAVVFEDGSVHQCEILGESIGSLNVALLLPFEL